ncbi:MAG TPA: methylated-DNA--[protein]-cysteine S-methyltransferase [Victivallales bacterium]|nr:methylated-DNA--[protein]-cysteine S-methyltransferase [Victivallales bacterium]HRR06385.1 methylated-DNA--[protein]-cysteine S-methyltransferase [Victivallales bacterium]HRU00271.1 methylated-DNA--[protein]-cysteine S-methyltransferase [Victivallales bacterium]
MSRIKRNCYNNKNNMDLSIEKVNLYVPVIKTNFKFVFCYTIEPFLIKRLKIYKSIFVENYDSWKRQKSKLFEKIILLDKFFCNEIENLPLDDLDLSSFSNFEKNILLALRKVKRGETISYAGLAKIANYPSSYARAVGNLMKKNPFPLFFPCHRVIKSNGEIGEFSGGGGKSLKKKLLFLEQKQKSNLKNPLKMLTFFIFFYIFYIHNYTKFLMDL